MIIVVISIARYLTNNGEHTVLRDQQNVYKVHTHTHTPSSSRLRTVPNSWPEGHTHYPPTPTHTHASDRRWAMQMNLDLIVIIPAILIAATTVSIVIYIYIHDDLVPKGAQEKRTEELENKVDRMWVSNAFFEWTREVINQWREKAVLLFVPEKFDFQCDLW